MARNTQEKVRGMNAALTGPETGGGLREREPARLHFTRRQVALALAIATLGAVAAIFTVHSITAAATTFPGVVSPEKTYNLNFPVSGRLTALNVKPGIRVTKGQLLATQDTTELRQAVTAAQAAVTAATAAVSQAKTPQVSPAQQQQDSLKVQQAQVALSNDENALATAQASGSANVSAAQAGIQADQQLVGADQARFAQACSAAQVQSSQSIYLFCQRVGSQTSTDEATLANAQAHLAQVQAEAQVAANQAQSQVNSDQAALRLAQSDLAVQEAPANTSDVMQAEANLATAQNNLSKAQAALQQADLIAPDDGTVAQVYGNIGENVGPNGVQQYPQPAALPANQSPGFSLFPSQPATGNGSTATNGNEPLIQLIGGPARVLAQVSESHIDSFRVGARAHVSINALKKRFSATVADIVLTPSKTTNSVTYDVYLNLDDPPSPLLPGMSASVTPG